MSRRVVIVGGGITGLATAYFLGEAGTDVVLLEASDRLGGKIRTEELEGRAIDVGADSFLARQPHAKELAAALGLSADLRAPIADRVWLSVGGRLRRFPSRTVFGVPTDRRSLAASRTLSPRALARVLSEPLRPTDQPLRGDASVATVVSARFGTEVVDRLVEPLLGGVYAGRADELSVEATIPPLAEAVRAEGSLLRRLAERRPAEGGVEGPVFLTLGRGLGSLAGALSERVHGIELGATATEVAPASDGWQVTSDAGEWRADAVVLATPATVTSRLVAGVSPDASRGLGTLRYASVAVVNLAYPHQVIHRVPKGSGVLVPRSQGRLVKAVTLSSQKWPHLAVPDAPFVLRASIGRIDAPPPDVDDAALVDAVAQDLARLIGVAGTPSAWRVTRWPESMPQYDVGHVGRVQAIRDALRRDAPGLYLAGAAYDGVGIAHCVRQAREVAFALTT